MSGDNKRASGTIEKSGSSAGYFRLFVARIGRANSGKIQPLRVRGSSPHPLAIEALGPDLCRQARFFQTQRRLELLRMPKGPFRSWAEEEVGLGRRSLNNRRGANVGEHQGNLRASSLHNFPVGHPLFPWVASPWVPFDASPAYEPKTLACSRPIR
jgi:hypothetical protein